MIQLGIDLIKIKIGPGAFIYCSAVHCAGLHGLGSPRNHCTQMLSVRGVHLHNRVVIGVQMAIVRPLVATILLLLAPHPKAKPDPGSRLWRSSDQRHEKGRDQNGNEGGARQFNAGVVDDVTTAHLDVTASHRIPRQRHQRHDHIARFGLDHNLLQLFTLSIERCA